MLCDFHVIEQHVNAVIEPFHNANLNETAPFDQRNPTAEAVAEYLYQSLVGHIPQGASLHRVEVGESPGCTAVYAVNLD